MRIEKQNDEYATIGFIHAKPLPRLKQLESILDEILETVKNLDSFFDAGKGDDDYFSGIFRFIVEFDDGSRMGEKALWETLVDTEKLDEKIVLYIKTITAQGLLHAEPGLWWDEQNPAGSFAANAMVLRNMRKADLRLYADYLASNNMSNEVYQESMIERILNEVSRTPDALYLIATRLTRASGQHGHKLLKKRGAMLNLSLEREKQQEFFLKLVSDWCVPTEPAKPNRHFHLLTLSPIATMVYAHDLPRRDAWLTSVLDKVRNLGYSVDATLHKDCASLAETVISESAPFRK